MNHPIQFNVKFKSRTLETLKYAIKYFSLRVTPNNDDEWTNKLFKKIKLDDSGNLIVTWDEEKDEWDPNYGDDISDLLIPFVEKGEIIYNYFSGKIVRVICLGPNESKYIIYKGKIEESVEEYEYKWDLDDLPILKHLVFNYIIEEAKFNPKIYLNGLLKDYGLSYNIVEDIIYILKGKQLLEGNITNSSKILQIDKIKELKDLVSVCSVCSQTLFDNDIFCSNCGAHIGYNFLFEYL